MHNIRSAHNVGSLLRTAEGLGVRRVYFSGYSPYPALANDPRLPHEAARASRQIQKTSLGAEENLELAPTSELVRLARDLGAEGYHLVALEQAPQAVLIGDFKAPDKIALLVGNELKGLDSEALSLADAVIELPMYGKKESYNVAVAGGMALHHLRHL